MIAQYVPAFLAVVAVATYVLQLWTGIAFAGWAGDDSIVERERRPGPYWLVMGLQTIFLVAAAVFMAASR